SAEELRASGDYPIMTPEELIARARAMGPLDSILLHPLMGGLDPEFSWQCLRLVESRVLPALRD
ncbi:MAG: LLM class flavin-dependent oxidoreductase, partial [Gemmatimonadetes bacterium]|nr:LLM class flavin-dependent oxidoreductase [Gemmatimonadota bacterium]